MYTDPDGFGADAGGLGVFDDDVSIDGPGIKMTIQFAGAIVSHRTEEGTLQVKFNAPAVFHHLQIFFDKPQHHRMKRDIADLVAFSPGVEVHDALAALDIPQPEEAQLLAPDAVIEQGSKNGTVPYTLQRVRGRGLQQSPGLRIAQGGSAALIVVGCGPLHTVHRIADDRVALTEIVEQR